MSRSCGDCTKCCEGYLSGSANGKTFYNGKPCHFLSIGKGCTIYAKRPKDPCQAYKCAWLIDDTLPEWFKPNEINAIVDYREIEGIKYLNVVEAGETLRSNVLSWLIVYALSNNINIYWNVAGGSNWIGSTDFLKAMERRNKPKGE